MRVRGAPAWTLACAVCGGSDLRAVLDLGTSPPTCLMRRAVARPLRDVRYPLQLLRCEDCGFVPLSVSPPPEEVFPDDYPYSSGNSPALLRHFEEIARDFDPGPDGLVVDVGANDGSLLAEFDSRTVGIEPTAQGAKIAGEWYEAPLDVPLAVRVREEHGPADVVTACNVLAHVPSVREALAAIRYLLADDGLLVAEFHDLGSVVDGQWDAVYHEHLRYFDPYTFDLLLHHHGFGTVRTDPVETHGGSVQVVAQVGESDALRPTPREYDFAALRRRARENRLALRSFCAERGPVIGIGATARATTIVNYCGLDVEDVIAVGEVTGSDKIGRLVPGTRIPIVDERELDWDRDAVLFSWHLAETIVPRWRESGYLGLVHVPIGEAARV